MVEEASSLFGKEKNEPCPHLVFSTLSEQDRGGPAFLLVSPRCRCRLLRMKSFFRHSQVWLALLSGHLVLAAPSLCLAGLLMHPCECESTGCSEGAGCSDGCSDECDCSPQGCSHDDCENDPCQTRSTSAPDRPGRIDLDLSLRLVAPLFLLPAAFLETAFEAGGPMARLGRRSFGVSLGPPGVLKRIPYHSADLPLLR